jgi:DNA-binding NtrC family response regulator
MENKDHNILVIEDERPLLAAVQKKLELNGFETVTARSVEQAMSYLDEVENISAIWLDHYLYRQRGRIGPCGYIKKRRIKMERRAYFCSF